MRARRFAKDRDRLAAILFDLHRSKLKQEGEAWREYREAVDRRNWPAAASSKRRREQLQRELESGRFFELARRVDTCHRIFRGFSCRPEGHLWAEPVHSCHVRLCPFDMRERAMRAQRRFGKIIDGLAEGKYAVFAERNCTLGGLAKGIKSLFDSWRRLRSHPIWAQVKGSLVAMELTYNRETREWHPHLNVVFDGPFLAFEKLNEAWIEATRGNGRTSFIKKANRGTSRELLKYITKLNDFIDVPEAVGDFLLSTKRRRFIRTYGTLYDIGLDDDEDGAGEKCCPDCSSRDVYLWARCLYDNQVDYDNGGVLRIPGAVRKTIDALRARNTGSMMQGP